MADPVDRFSAGARRVLYLANQEATRLHHNYMGTEHLLLGLLREPSGLAHRILANLARSRTESGKDWSLLLARRPAGLPARSA